MTRQPVHIVHLHIRNYKAFQDAEMNNIPSVSVLVGKNGAGKTTLFDVFRFLQEALLTNVTEALNRRGGFKEVVSRGQPGPIEMDLTFRESGGQLATYSLKISPEGPRGIVLSEVLQYQGHNREVFNFSLGTGQVAVAEPGSGNDIYPSPPEEQTLESKDILALKGLGQFQRFPAACDLRRLIESWKIPDLRHHENILARGESLARLASDLYRFQPGVFEKILNRMRERAPGPSSLEAQQTVDGRIVLKVNDNAFRDPFRRPHVSDGTMKMFAYLLLLQTPDSHPLLALDHPEQQIYPELLEDLWADFKDYAMRGGQLIASTHSRDLLKNAELSAIYVLLKENGFTTIKKASESRQLRALAEAGDRTGELFGDKAF